MTDSRRPWPTGVVIAVLAGAGFAVSLMQTILVPLLSDLPGLLNVAADDASWLITATVLASAVVTPSVTRLADMFGKRRMMLASLVAMLAGSILGAVGASLALLITARVLQGLSLGLIPVGMSIMRDELPRERLAAAVALMSATFGIGSAVGLPLAGVIYATLGWHAVFWVSAVLAVVVLVAVIIVIPESAVRTGGRFDLLGGLLLSVALASLVLGITEGGRWGWASRPTLSAFVVAVVLLAVWVPQQLRVTQPLVDLRTTVRRPVLMTNISSLLVGFAMYCNMLATTQLLGLPVATGYSFGLSVTRIGLAMVPSSIVMVALAPVSAALTRKFGARVTLILGSAVLAVGYIGRVFLMDSEWQIIVGTAVVYAGVAIGYAAMPVLIMRSVPITETAAANGLNSLVRSLGASTASAAVAAILTTTVMTVGHAVLPSLLAFQHVFFFASIAALGGGAAALAIPTRRAAAQGVAAASLDEIRGPGRGHELVARGFVLDGFGEPVEHAVVGVSLPDGEPIDWSRVDATGGFDVAIPEPGQYVVVASAPGVAASSKLTMPGDPASPPTIRLSERLTISGEVISDDQPATNAIVSLTDAEGAPINHGTADAAGRFSFDLPEPGHYILTAVNPAAESVRSVDVAVGRAPVHVLLELNQEVSM